MISNQSSKGHQQGKVNEKKVPKRYQLTTLREGGYYEPLTEEEFEQFKVQNPDLVKYFTDESTIDELSIPEVNEHAPIYDHWEKAA